MRQFDEIEAALDPIQARFNTVNSPIDSGNRDVNLGKPEINVPNSLLDVRDASLDVADVRSHAIEFLVEATKIHEHDVIRLIRHRPLLLRRDHGLGIADTGIVDVGLVRILVDARFDLMTEMRDQALDRPGGGVAERADGVTFDLFGHF